ncbi:MAG: hypothetical protein F4Y49_11850 [Dehalococcoidia bacterium]|nr:hypothetical protein [Dehalococcoidia bacterium]
MLNPDLRWEEGRLRFYDPVSGRWLESNAESLARAEAEHDARIAAEVLAESEREARIAAEVRMAEMEAELRRLSGE